MEQNTNILITLAGRRVSLVNSFKLELKAVLPQSRVLATDSQPGLSAASLFADDFFQVPSLAQNNNYLSKLLEICKQNKVGLIIPTLDPELLALAEHKHLFEQIGTHILMSDLDHTRIFDNKKLTSDFFRKLNIEVPAIYSKENYKFPFFVKPINGSASKNNHIIKSEADLCDHFFKDPNLQFFEYFSPEEFQEYTCDMYYDKNGFLKCVVPRIRLEVRSGESSKGVTKKNYLMQFLIEKMGHIPGVKGCITSQFFVHRKDEKVIKGIEINGRFGGGYPLAYHAGANFPKWAVQEYLFNKKIDYFDTWEENLLMLRYDNELLIHEFK